MVSTFERLFQHFLDLTISNVRPGYSYKNIMSIFYTTGMKLKKLYRIDEKMVIIQDPAKFENTL